MPELPEVETIGRALRPALTGQRIVKVEIFRPAMRTPLTPLLAAHLEGRTVTGVRRRSRYLLADLDDGRALLLHFGMTGVVRVEPAAVPRRKHEHLFLHLGNGLAFRFECVRRFSRCEVCEVDPATRLPAELAAFGPEPFDPAFNGPELYRRSRGVKTPVKVWLMDNETAAGIGNIYATESCFAAGVDPRRAAGRISRPRYEKLAEAVRTILARAIAAGGTTVSDFRHVDGSQGKFATELKVYGKAGSPCPVCGRILEKLRQGGRTTVFCPRCQKCNRSVIFPGHHAVTSSV